MSLLLKCFQLNNYARVATVRAPVISSLLTPSNEDDLFYTQKRYAARKGKRIAATREKQRLARARREELKNAPPKVWKPKRFLIDRSLNAVAKKFSDSDRKGLEEIVDNVYIIDQYKERKFPLNDVFELVRQIHHPTIYDEPDALVLAKVELNLRTKKKTKFVESLRGIISYSNLFQYAAKRKVVAICKTEDDQESAKNAGAELVGSSDIIRMLKLGDISMENYDDLVCHGDMFIELAAIKSTLGFYFPTKQRGNIGFDMSRLVGYFVNGIEFKMNKDAVEPDYGFIEMPFGRLTQTNEELEENLETLLDVVDKNKSVGAPGDFISRVLVKTEPSPEKFAIAFWNHVDGYEDPNLIDDDQDEVKISEKSKKKAAKN